MYGKKIVPKAHEDPNFPSLFFEQVPVFELERMGYKCVFDKVGKLIAVEGDRISLTPITGH